MMNKTICLKLFTNTPGFKAQLNFTNFVFGANIFIGRCMRTKWIEPLGFDTGIKIYNPVVKKKVNFVTRLKNIVSWYACGPTVYDSAHLGHGCCYISQDIFRRIMENFFNLKVVFVLGITDIDDKIIAKAAASRQEFTDVSRHYEKEFLKDMASLNINPPTLSCRVSDNIPAIQEFISSLISKGFGYLSPEGSVYFSVNKFPLYGCLSNIPEESNSTAGKLSSNDFALWKAAKENEPFWLSPWGKGRPGWHIECSAMASKIFGNSLDLHSGGIDLIFPHHENEEAQSCCYHEVNQWVNYWLHIEHLTMNNAIKMSKSLKNTISISEFLQKYSADHLRMFCLVKRHRQSVEYSEKALDNAVALCAKFDHFLHDCELYIRGSSELGAICETELLTTLYETEAEVYEALADDFNTARAISLLTQLVSLTNTMLHQPMVSAAEMTDYGQIMNSSLDFRFKVRKAALNIGTSETKDLKSLKQELLNYCDEYRRRIMDGGIEIKDHSGMSAWRFRQ